MLSRFLEDESTAEFVLFFAGLFAVGYSVVGVVVLRMALDGGKVWGGAATGIEFLVAGALSAVLWRHARAALRSH